MTALYNLFFKLYKLLLFLCLNIFFLLSGIIIKALSFLKEEKMTKTTALLSMLWAQACCRILGIRVALSGNYQGFKLGFIVCNHISYLDILVMGGIRPSIFVSKIEVKRWPLLGWLAVLANTIFIDRESKKGASDALIKMERRLKGNVNIIVFPEGTTTDGSEVKRFKSTLFDLPARMDLPVIPVSLKYTHINGKQIEPSEMDTIAWHGDMRLVPHLWNLLGIRDIEVNLHFNPAISDVSDAVIISEKRKVLSQSAYKSVIKGLINPSP